MRASEGRPKNTGTTANSMCSVGGNVTGLVSTSCS